MVQSPGVTLTRGLTPVLLLLIQRVLDILQAQSPPQERHEGQLQELEALGQDPEQGQSRQGRDLQLQHHREQKCWF